MHMNGSPPSVHTNPRELNDTNYRLKNTSSDGGSSKHQSYASENVHFKILVPSVAAGAVIGKKGDAIAQVQKETGARVKMSKSNDFYPGTSERVCLILGTVEAILRVHDYIMDKIIEKPEQHSQFTVDSMGTIIGGSVGVGGGSSSGNGPIGTGETSEHSPPTLSMVNGSTGGGFLSPLWSNEGGGNDVAGQLAFSSITNSDNSRFPTERHKQVKILVPNSTAGMIIGKGGQFIKEIKEASGAYVQISQKSKDLNINLPERCVIIAGEREHNRNAVRMILQKISEDPQSATCPNISYAEVSGPLPSAYPTGSPFAQLTSINNFGGGIGGGPGGGGGNNNNPMTTSPMIRPSAIKNSRASLHRPRLSSDEFGCWSSAAGVGVGGLSVTKNGIDHHHHHSHHHHHNALTSGGGGPLSTLPPTQTTPNGLTNSNHHHHHLRTISDNNKLSQIRDYLRSMGYSEHAANEISNAIQVLSNYGLFNQQTPFGNRNKTGFSLTFDNNILASPSMLTDKSQVLSNGIMPGMDPYHMPASPNLYSPSPSIYNPNLSNVFSSSNLGFNNHMLAPGCADSNVPLMQPLMITSGIQPPSVPAPQIPDSCNPFSNLFSPDYTYHQSTTESTAGCGPYNATSAYPYLPYLDQQAAMYDSSPVNQSIPVKNPSPLSSVVLSEHKITPDMFHHSPFAHNIDYNMANKLPYNMQLSHLSGQGSCNPPAPSQQENIASIPTSAI